MSSEDSKRIAKNTLFLYVRMILILTVSLYTSRIVLKILGESDFGVYNVVGGVIILFTFITQALASGTQRFITFEIGKPNGSLSKIFNVCLNIHFGLCLLLIIVGETIGLWFINSKMNFPLNSLNAVNWVYQITLLSCIVTIVRFPYNAMVIAYEKMNFYAYNSILEAVLKLFVLWFLLICDVNKLILYAFLNLGVSIIITFSYYYYTSLKISKIKYDYKYSLKSYVEVINFSGWAIFGGFAAIGLRQGLNIIINLFYGVTVNAAVGIANQVNGAVTQFVQGFQQAVNPQLIKSEASKDRSRQSTLIEESAKLSYFIMLIIIAPLLFNIGYVLYLWLGTYPAETPSICVFVIIGALIESVSGPLWIVIFATGKIKWYQIVISLLMLINLPIGYIICSFAMSPWTVFASSCVLYLVILFARLWFMKHLCDYSIQKFSKKVLCPILFVSSLIFGETFLIRRYYLPSENLLSFLLQS